MNLRLESITIHNFKSYKGTHVIQGLDPRFTAVVGANGSGKSNIIDSILFVLGFRARRMRHSSMAGLIYSGDGNQDMCYVELGFNKFQIRREVSLAGRTRYFVDGEEVPCTMVESLLKSEGVDMEHNRFLILQGEIENIAMIKPMDGGLLEYLEDVIGTGEYKAEIEKEESELRRVSEECESKSAALKFYEKEYKHIERKQEECLRTAKRRAECLCLDRDLHLLFSERGKKKLEGLLLEKKKIEEDLQVLEKKNKENGGKLEVLEGKGANARVSAREAEERFLKARKEYQRAERRNKMMEEDLERESKRIEELSREISEIRCLEDKRQKEGLKWTEEINRNVEEISRCSELSEKLRSEIGEGQRRIEKEARKSIEEIYREEERMMKLLKRKGEIGEKQRESESRLGILMSRKEEILRRVGDIDGRLSKMDEGKIEMGRSEEEISREIEEIERDLAKTRKEMSRRMQRAEEHRENEETSWKEREILRSIEHVKGVYGRLSDLGSVESQYDRAFRIAGKGLNSIVVDTTCTAEECISIIKSLGLGRATFIILDRISSEPSLPKESVPYLYNLVKCPKEFRKCFYFALKDTLVCEGLEVAERLAFGKTRKRVVTIDGKLIEKSGVMSGGKGNGRIKSIEELEKACLKMMELKKKKVSEMDMVRDLKERGALWKTRERLASDLEEVCREIGRVEKRINRKEIEDIEVEIEKIKKKVSSLREGIESLTDMETRRKKENLRNLNERIEVFEKRNLELRLHLESSGSGELREKELEVERRKKDFERISIEDISGMKSKMIECEREYKECAERLRGILKEIANVKASLGNDYHMEIDLKNRLDDACDKIEEWTQRIKESETKIASLEEESKKYMRICRLEIHSTVKVEEMNEEEIDRTIGRIGGTVARLKGEEIGEIDLDVFEDCERARVEYEKAKGEHGWFESRQKEIKESLEYLKKKRYDEFMKGFTQVSENLKEIYKSITHGGNAELELVDHLDPFSEGVVLSVMPPKKSWKNIGNLSGGEKTLSSLALIFALHKFRPSPFYVMDEIDAALDYRNVGVISHFIKEMSRTAQFLVISLRSDMFELSETLLGVYKANNASQSLIVNIGKLAGQ
ncbi:chromosome segregation ATPase [Encephalitozoon intestinalis ATCC 50506]|uniref:Chromosome segregation ATPase n=1 Tax=Encephalitozoon intestinalis (strain ATCC 50506) TaxID=876142 RepID=E0S7Z1_ENCIT|nr:chromosome segregation ATPase [Encephalitozoon intestinalis ATCC 50506]ADM11826.2 chromosome segregation ATPase [Encephalitozoon intestinalis ATCC 50506]UTX45576.1 structural maintenance of chromosomes protein [Encephalitozoon intestinalis]